MIITNEIKEARQRSDGLVDEGFNLLESVQPGQSDADGIGWRHRDDEQPTPAGIPICIDAGLEGEMAVAEISTPEHLVGRNGFVNVVEAAEGAIRACRQHGLVTQDIGNHKGLDFSITVNEVNLLADGEVREKLP